MVVAENEVLGFTHPQVGGLLLRAWKFPEALVAIVACHHNPLACPDNIEPSILHLADIMLVVHFEKGRPGYKGVYQAINQLFLADAGPGYTLVNREQDLGDDGLRQSKLSYNPVGFLRKCLATVAARE